jgi:hypothetical protein
MRVKAQAHAHASAPETCMSRKHIDTRPPDPEWRDLVPQHACAFPEAGRLLPPIYGTLRHFIHSIRGILHNLQPGNHNFNCLASHNTHTTQDVASQRHQKELPARQCVYIASVQLWHNQSCCRAS